MTYTNRSAGKSAKATVERLVRRIAGQNSQSDEAQQAKSTQSVILEVSATTVTRSLNIEAPTLREAELMVVNRMPYADPVDVAVTRPPIREIDLMMLTRMPYADAVEFEVIRPAVLTRPFSHDSDRSHGGVWTRTVAIALQIPLPTVALPTALRFGRPAVRSKPITRFHARRGTVTLPLLPRKATAVKYPSNELKMGKPKIVRATLEAAYEMPLTRRRLRTLNDAAFKSERAALCRLAAIDDSDLKWIGLFRLVPIAAAQAMEVDDQSGVISIILRQNAKTLLEKQSRPTVAIAMGRNRRTGALIQILVR